jgi:tetratricopeptide (TPR) repeat protein
VLRLVGFFIAVLVALEFLRHVPLIGAIFRVPLLGFYLAAIVVAGLLSRYASAALDQRKQKALERQLGAVDTPHNKGKLGLLLLAQRRYAKAMPLLAEASHYEPESAELHYRFGSAALGANELEVAVRELEACTRIEEEHAYGSAMLRLAEAYSNAELNDNSRAAIDRFERNHGPSPESAFRRGLALRATGDGEGARKAFGEVSALSTQVSKFQKKGASGWVLRAWLARLSTR